MLRFFLSLISCLCAFVITSCTQADAQKSTSAERFERQAGFERLVQSANLIVIAEVSEPTTLPDTPQEKVKKPSDVQIDLEKEIDRAREATEETARTLTGLNLSSFVKLKTVETLKGPSTNILSIEASTEDLKKAEPGQLFLIFMGVNHPDAIKLISTVNDPWVQKIKNEIAESN